MKPATALIGWGQVRHTRHRPAHHAFAYTTAFLMLPMRSVGMAQMRWLGVEEGHHSLSHDPDDKKESYEKLTKINTPVGDQIVRASSVA